MRTYVLVSLYIYIYRLCILEKQREREREILSDLIYRCFCKVYTPTRRDFCKHARLWKGTKDCEALAKPSSDSKLKLRMTRPCNDKLECRCVDAEGSILLLRSMYSYTSLDTVSRRYLISIGVSGAAVPVFAWLTVRASKSQAFGFTEFVC